MFANDIKIYENEEDHSILQNDLNLLHEWWQLNFNIVKCKHLHFETELCYGLFYLNDTVIASVISHKNFYTTT